jgi:3-dehydroquinate synthase
VAVRLVELLRQYRLPTEIPAGMDRDALRRYLQTDKKTIGGRVFFVLPEAIGKVRITDQVDDADIDAILAGTYSDILS